MSTEDRSSGADLLAPEERSRSFDPDDRYRLSPNVALRPESFGALAYHFGNRKLSFLKSPRLVSVVRSLSEHSSVHAALEANGVPAAERTGYLRALASLTRTDMIIPV